MKHEGQTPEEEQQLEQFVLRLLAPPIDLRNRQPRLLPGTLPENFPLTIPIPEKSRILGTLVRSEEHVEIVLESDLAQEEVTDFYSAQLTSQGWKQPEDFPHRMGGFLHTSIPGPQNFMIFCQGENGAALTLNIVQRENTATDIRLHFNLSSEDNPCNQQRRRRHLRGPYEMLPPLAPPAGAQQRGGSSGSGDTEFHANGTLTTELELDTLAQHYREQLSKGGWTPGEGGINGPVAWQNWTFTDEEQQSWSALFFIMKKSAKAQKYALFVEGELEASDNANKFAGWSGSSSGMSSSLGGFLFRTDPH